jgi:hypothetical protein
MIEKVDTNQINSFLEKSSSRLPKNAAASPGYDAGITVQVDYAQFIDDALKIPQEDSHIIRQAKELLFTGRLESTENVIKAAKNIITLGI